MTVSYWSEDNSDRLEFLRLAVQSLDERKWGRVLDSGWAEWDIAVHCGAGSVLEVCTVQEDHGGGKRLIRVRYRLGLVRWTMVLNAAITGGLAMIALTTPIPPLAAMAVAGALIVAQWQIAGRAAFRVTEVFDVVACKIGLVTCPPEEGRRGWRGPREGTRDVPASLVTAGVVPPSLGRADP